MESPGCGAAGDITTYGNEAGRGLLEERQEMKEMMERMKSWMASKDVQSKRLEDQMANKDIQIANQQTQIESLGDRMANKDIQIADQQTQIKSLGDWIADKDTQIADQETQITDLQDRVNTLTKDAAGYHGIRHRFIDVYRRDHFGGLTEEGDNRIRAGNVFAHEGDATADARLFTTGQRNDADALVDLYGLTVDQISFLDEARFNHGIATLNTGAAWIARGRANIPEDVADTFQTFTLELIANLDQNLTNQSLTGNTALGRANRAFSAAHYRGLRQRRQRVVP